MELTRREAQALAVIASKLDRKPFSRKVQPADMLEVITHLGMVQLDTISVVSRAHETALWSRLGPYNLDHWTTLFEQNRLTEYLTHAAAITPTQYVPLMKLMMSRRSDRGNRWWENPTNAALARGVMERVQAEGPLGSRHFESQPDAARNGEWESWYGSKPEREALARLWHRGELLISLRDRGFGRWFDLPERVAPDHWDLESPPGEEWKRTIVQHAMRALGIGTAPWVTDYWRTGGAAYVPNKDVRRILAELAAEGVLTPVTVPGVEAITYLHSNLLPVLEQLRQGSAWPTRTTILSPFDNLIWNRGRMRDLFGMEYTLEIYVPEAKRQFGYYTMPILHRGQLVGRIDPSLNRRQGLLTIKSLHLQPGVKPTPALARAIAKSLDEFCVFLGATEWLIEGSHPVEFAELVADC